MTPLCRNDTGIKTQEADEQHLLHPLIAAGQREIDKTSDKTVVEQEGWFLLHLLWNAPAEYTVPLTVYLGVAVDGPYWRAPEGSMDDLHHQAATPGSQSISSVRHLPITCPSTGMTHSLKPVCLRHHSSGA